MDGGTRTPTRRCWRPVLCQSSYVHSLLLSCHLVGNTKGPLREAASPGVLVTLVDFCLRWSGPVRTGALSAPTSAAPAGREATGPWSQRTRSLRPSTASGQHPARKPHCGSRRRGFVACPLRWSFRYVLQWPVPVDRPTTRVGLTLPPGLTNCSLAGIPAVAPVPSNVPRVRRRTRRRGESVARAVLVAPYRRSDRMRGVTGSP